MANIMLLLVLSAIGVLVAPNTLREVSEDGDVRRKDCLHDND